MSWFVRNVREMRWWDRGPRGFVNDLVGDDDAQLGVNLFVLARAENEEVDTELRVVVADEIVDEAARAAVPPPHLTDVPDEPAHPAGTLSPQAVKHDVEI